MWRSRIQGLVLSAGVIWNCPSWRMTSLSSSGRDCGTCVGESGLLCGAETADQTGTCSCDLGRASAYAEESGDEARVTCDPGETGTGPCVFSAEICLLWAGIATFSSAGTLTSSWADSVSEAGS